MRIKAEKHSIHLVLIACFMSVFLFVANAQAQTTDKDKDKADAHGPLDAHGSIEFGATFRDIKGDHPDKFQEMRHIPKGLTVNKLALDLDSVDSPYIFKLRGLEIRETDQRFFGEIRKIGKYRGEFIWDQIPHRFGTGQSFLQPTSPGYYSVSPTLRAALQTAFFPPPGTTDPRTPANGPGPTLVRQELATAPFTEVRLRRDNLIIRQSLWLTNRVEIYGQFSWLRNRGSRPMSVGTFVRRAVVGPSPPTPPLGDIGGSWEGLGQEFLEPIDQRTTGLRFGAQFNGDRWQAGVEYDLSLFRNNVESVIFENPFRVMDAQGCTPNTTPPLCQAQFRLRGVRWQSDLPPNNDSHTITLWARLDLTPKTQVRGVFSLGYWTQNDAFLPWTLNTAIKPINWNPAELTVTDPTNVNQLPASSPNAKMRNINQEYALVNRHDTFRFLAKYRSQFLDNQSPQIIFPGYAAFGDSTWRAARTDFFNIPIENLDWDFRRQNIDGGFDWDVLPQLTWRLDYGWEIWNRKFRDVNRNNEHSIRNRLDFEYDLSGSRDGKTHARPLSLTTLNIKLDYRYANRKALAYNTQPLSFVSNFPGSPAGGNTTAWIIDPPTPTSPGTILTPGVPTEFNLLRRYDQNDRIRNDAGITLELHKGPNTSFSASYRYLGDEHDQSLYGRLYNRYSFVNAGFTHVFGESNFFYANYAYETNRFAYRDLAHLLPAPNPNVQGVFAQFPIANTWERTSRNALNSFEFGVNVAPMEGALQNWQFDLAYAVSAFRDRITTANPYTVRPDSVLHAGANPYPDVVIRRHDVNLAVTRRINDKYEVGVRYWYEPYSQDDFSFNILAPYIHGSATSDLPKYMFQDARYGTYHANTATVFLRYSF